MHEASASTVYALVLSVGYIPDIPDVLFPPVFHIENAFTEIL